MDKLLRARTPLRAAFTRTVNILKEELKRETADNGVLEDKLEKLKKLSKDLMEHDKVIFDALLDKKDVTDDEINKESESTEEYFDTFITVRRLVNESLLNSTMHEFKNNKDENLSVVNKIRNFKLPKVELVKFDGELINFLPFWSQFQKINDDEELNDCDKFHYLVQSMKPGTRAKEFIDSYPITSDNYKRAVTALKERFGKKELLTEVYVRELLKLIVHNVGNQKEKLPLSKLVDKLEAYLRSLDSMGVEREANAAWLYPMVESCLAEDMLRAWQRSPVFNTSPETENLSGEPVQKALLTQLMEFLHREVQGEERMLLARRNFCQTISPQPSRDEAKSKYRTKRDSLLPTAAGLYAGKNESYSSNFCIFCEKPHDSKDCFLARSWPLNDRIKKLKENRCCLKCMRTGHVLKFCKKFVRCHICEKGHPVLLCPDLDAKLETQVKTIESPEIIQTAVARRECSGSVTLMTLEVNIVNGRSQRKVRALLDCGSQRSYIKKSTASILGLKSIGSENMSISLFGGNTTESMVHEKYRIKLKSKVRNEKDLEFEFLEQNVICTNVPRLTGNTRLLKELKKHKIWLTDLSTGSTEIEMLIGSDIYGRLLTGKIIQLSSGLTAIETKLGWTVCGQESTRFGSNDNITCISTFVISNLAIRDFNVAELWDLETIGIRDPCESVTKTTEEEHAYTQLLNTLTKNEEGRYCVGLPWRDDHSEIPSNRHLAEKRLIAATRKLKAAGMFQEYDKVFEEWLEEKVIERVPSEQLNYSKCHYLPHHPVIKAESLTTKIRPVFDASCKVGSSPSLNDCLLKGPNLIELIPSMLMRFREKPIGVVADIRRAFLQIEVRKADREYLRFLWWENETKIQVFRHNRVVFGVTSSPFLLGGVLKHHLSNVAEEFRPVAQKLLKSFYVDNCITSVENEFELKCFIEEATAVLAQGQMDLRMWEFGPYDEMESTCNLFESHSPGDLTTPVPILGLRWNKMEDCLMIDLKVKLKSESPSKREILSITQGIFDPVGFLSPVLLHAKLLIQQAWTLKSNWDTPLPENICSEFIKWYNELKFLEYLKIPRRVGFGPRSSWSIHVFCDASSKAYASVIFLRCEDFEVSVQLLIAKSRLAPLKQITIPRLELLACVLGARLSRMVIESLDLSACPIYFWTDSSTAIAWIQRDDHWGTFVGNRTREIRHLTSPERWFHVPGKENPADLPSRGCNPTKLVLSRWWEGPEWLKRTESDWPSVKPQFNETDILSEKRKCPIVNLSANCQQPSWFERISKFSRIVRVLGWIRRFYKNTHGKENIYNKTLSDIELEEAEITLWKIVQKDSFPEDEETCINRLNIMKGNDGLIRLKTKIVEREDDFSFRYPILLPAKHYVTTCLVTEYHLKNCHAGVQVLASKLREKYWIIASKRLIRKVITKCVRCKRFSAKSLKTAPIHLPFDRVRDAAVFEVTGIDLCGPLYLKNKRKSWVVLYTCAVYRAVHLEAVTSLSSEAFIQSLRRFIARRGRPSTIYTDNGTNFSGTNHLLKDLNWEKIQSVHNLSPIKWKFIPPRAPWWGGFWERLVRSVKNLLVRVLGRSSVNFEELYTILCDIESTINSRPLTFINEGCDDFSPLSPVMFLQDVPTVGVADLDHIDRERLQIRYKYCQQLREELRSRFRREYLGELVQRAREPVGKSSIKVGDVVLVELDGQKRIRWPMARILKIFPSRDGNARVAELKTTGGTLIRPLQKLYPLEVTSEDDPVFIPKRSRSGRLLKRPDRLGINSTNDI